MNRTGNKGYGNVDFERLALLAEDIVFSEAERVKVMSACYSGLEEKRRKQRKWYYRAAAIVLVFLITAITAVMVSPPNVLVYASGISGKVRLKTGESVILKKQFTPLGMGYMLTLDTGEAEAFYTIETGEHIYPENVFQNSNTIYWLPDGVLNGKLSDENGEIIHLPKTNKSVLKIRVSSKGGQKEDITLSLEQRENVCSVELLEEK